MNIFELKTMYFFNLILTLDVKRQEAHVECAILFSSLGLTFSTKLKGIHWHYNFVYNIVQLYFTVLYLVRYIVLYKIAYHSAQTMILKP